MDDRPGQPDFSLTGRTRTATVRLPPLVARALALLILLALLAVGIFLVVPLLIIGAAVLAIGLSVFWVRLKLARARQPNGVLDGRRNVRVRRDG